MIKPRIALDMEHGRYYCMDIKASFSCPVVGWGDTPKEALLDWYCGRIKEEMDNNRKEGFKLAIADLL